jgi:hypothetical protein
MRYEEFKRRLGKAGLTIRDFAGLIGVCGSTVSNYAGKGAVPAHLAVSVTLMSELAEHGIDFKPCLLALNLADRTQRANMRHAGSSVGKQTNLFRGMTIDQ